MPEKSNLKIIAMSDVIKEFKHCPFCGRIWMSLDQCAPDRFSVRCRCGATGPDKETGKKAIKAWNSRDRQILWNPFRLSIRFPKYSGDVDLKGSLSAIDFATVLQMLASRDKTGILQTIRGHLKSVICLKNGNIIAASDSVGLRIGQILHKNGMISDHNLKRALKTAKESGRMLGEVLLSLNIISPKTLEEVIRQQVLEAVLEMFRWQDGMFEYRDCVIDFVEQGIVELNAMEIIIESARRLERWNELKRKQEKE